MASPKELRDKAKKLQEQAKKLNEQAAQLEREKACKIGQEVLKAAETDFKCFTIESLRKLVSDEVAKASE